MSNDEFQMTNETRNPNNDSTAKPLMRSGSDFVLRHSFGFRHLSFVILSRFLAASIILPSAGPSNLRATESDNTGRKPVGLQFQLPSSNDKNTTPQLNR